MNDNNFFSRLWRNFARPAADTTVLEREVHAPRTPSTPSTPELPGKPAKVPGKILLVDDDLVIQRTVLQALEKKGYQVFIAGDISVALGLVRQEQPDLILLDLTFPFNPGDVGGPIKDGFFVIEWLRRATGAKKIPIVIISGSDPAQYRSQIFSAGIVACFQKPLDHGGLVSAIDGALGVGRWS